jgi:hypothetical protein
MLRDVLDRVPNKPERVLLPNDVRAYLQQNRVPADIIEDLEQSSYDNWISIGPVDVIPMPRLITETTGIAVCMEQGLLPVAGCRNFDPVVVNRDTRRVSYVSCDLLWERKWKNIQECLLDSPYLYEDFWNAALNDVQFPIDYYDAEERWPTSRPDL